MDDKSKIKSSIESLEMIYAVVVAFAITKAIEGILFKPTDSYADFSLLAKHFQALIAFLFTIAPFYHGMHRHLNRAYLEREIQNTKQHFLLLDFFVFFFESCILLVFATSLTLGIGAFKPLMTLLIVDSIWAMLAYRIHYNEWKNSPKTWASINIITIILMAPLLFSIIIESENIRLWILAILAIARTIADYKFCWHFYFPKLNN